MRITILIVTISLLSIDLFAQGGVNVIYIAIDTVDQSLVGQNVKIDFKSTRGTRKYLIQKARARDTIQLTIDKRPITVIERKGTGVDYWYFDKEYLESFDYDPELTLRINDIIILKMEAESILFRMTMERFKKTKETLERVSSETKDVWIPKEKIEGILIKEP